MPYHAIDCIVIFKKQSWFVFEDLIRQELLHWLLEVEVIVVIIDIVLINIVFFLAFASSNMHGRDGLCNARVGMAGNMNVSMVVVLDHRLLMHGVVLVRSAANDNFMLDRPMQGINDLFGLVLISVRIGFTLRIALLSLSLLLLLGAWLFVVFRLVLQIKTNFQRQHRDRDWWKIGAKVGIFDASSLCFPPNLSSS